ncbi:MAG: alanyl-tRNA editing protein [Polyangiaceae bacterium]|nr:alanyl-tRNA editing protein [Polyangiaceae bacterium]MBK8939811.1 alanyl-tRNA editing protein [Polyangiaceae bacterium]
MTAATARLYFEHPLLVDFEAAVVEAAVVAGKPAVVLDRSAFYPEAGGQMADHGELWVGDARFEVVDVQVDDDVRVHHTLRGSALPAVGDAARGRVDKARRRVHMALHTGQHLMSRALLDEAAAPTVSARLGETSCTIDVEVPSISEADLARAEDLVNAVIDDDRPIRAFFPSPEELARLPLRRAPKVTENIRVIDVDGFDVSPCGGTHCLRTAEVGLVKITSVERTKGKMRVHFVAGKRARDELTRTHQLVGLVAERLGSPRDSVLASIDKLRAELSVERERARGLSRDLAERVAAELLAGAPASGEGVFVATLAGTVELLRAVAAALGRQAEGPWAALLAGEDESGRPLLVTRGGGSQLDCGAALKRVATLAGGRGGGRPEHAEGRLPREADVVALWTAARRGQETRGE